MDAQGMAWQLGGGVLAGVAVAYALKKAAKLALIFLGLGIALLFGLAQMGIVVVNWSTLSQTLETTSKSAGAGALGLLKALGSSMVGFAGGVALGLKLR